MRITKLLGLAVSIAIPAFRAGSQEPGIVVTPQGLWAAQINPWTVRLAWNAVPGAGAYRISCAVGGRDERVLGSMLSGQVTTYASGVPRRISHAIPIRPTDLGAEYRCSLEWGTVNGRFYGKTAFNAITPVFATTSTKTRPVPVSAVATSASEDEITLTWEPVPGATAYTINREVAPLGFNPFCDLCSTTSTTIVDRVTEKSRKHRYFVTPITTSGAGARATSNYVVPGVPPDTTPVTPDTPITSPASITATVTGATSAKASWIAVRGPAAYELTRYIAGAKFQRTMRVPNDLPGVLIEVSEKLVTDPKAASAPLIVHYSVRSVDRTGKLLTEPVTSNTITVSVKEAAAAALAMRNVTNPRATTMSASSVILTWTPPAGSYLCDLERSFSSGSFGLIARLPTGAYRYIDEMPDLLAKAPRYRMRCQAGKLSLPTVAFPNPTPAG
jgi:hypothetical protein